MKNRMMMIVMRKMKNRMMIVMETILIEVCFNNIERHIIVAVTTSTMDEGAYTTMSTYRTHP